MVAFKLSMSKIIECCDSLMVCDFLPPHLFSKQLARAANLRRYALAEFRKQLYTSAFFAFIPAVCVLLL